MSDPEDHKVNGWHLRCHNLFLDRYEGLIAQVEELEGSDPHGFQHHSNFKLLVAVTKAVEEVVPADPAHSQFLCATLGNGGRWRRVKRGLPQRFRLFFQFNSEEKTVVYVWLNDELTLRKSGAKSDVYTAFQNLTRKGVIPSTFQQLLDGCEVLPKVGTDDE